MLAPTPSRKSHSNRPGFHGVSRERSGRWRACFAHRLLGTFDTPEEAAHAYNKAAKAARAYNKTATKKFGSEAAGVKMQTELTRVRWHFKPPHEKVQPLRGVLPALNLPGCFPWQALTTEAARPAADRTASLGAIFSS
jgi:hypothetical protein